jgi:hypothetical protein
MTTPSRNRTFEKLILTVGILVAVVAGLNSSPVENKQRAWLNEINVMESVAVTTEDQECKYLNSSMMIKLVESIIYGNSEPL